MARFSEAIDLVLSQEGGYSDDKNDPGGETNFGISKRSYPDLDIKALTRGEAVEIYRRDYWEPNKISLIKCQMIANKYFSFVVNMGTRPAGRIVQRAIRSNGVDLEIDGRVGSKTRKAINDITRGEAAFGSPDEIWRCWYALLAAIRSEAAGHYRLLIAKNSKLERFRNGWLNRAYE